MNYLPYIYLLTSLSIISLAVFTAVWILDFAYASAKQKLLFLKIGLMLIAITPFIFCLISLSSLPTLEIKLFNQLANQEFFSSSSAIFVNKPSWLSYIVYLYGACFIFMLSRILFSYLSAKKQLRSSKLAIIQGEEVWINTHIQKPISFGLPKAKIYFPQDVEIRWTSRELQMCLAHEKTHVEQKDSFWKLLSLIVQALLFFTPWVYYLHRKFELEMEIFCDEKTRGETNSSIQEYGTLLLTIASKHCSNLIFNNITDSTLKKRFLAMKLKSKNVAILLTILSMILLFTGGTTIAIASGIMGKHTVFKIKSKIIVDGELVSSPIIISKANQKALIVISNTNNTGAQGLRVELVAKNAANGAIKINYDIEYKNGNDKLHSSPVFTVKPNQEGRINLLSDSNHSLDMIVLAERE